MGLSRDTFYRYWYAVEGCGLEALLRRNNAHRHIVSLQTGQTKSSIRSSETQ